MQVRANNANDNRGGVRLAFPTNSWNAVDSSVMSFPLLNSNFWDNQNPPGVLPVKTRPLLVAFQRACALFSPHPSPVSLRPHISDICHLFW